MRNEKNSSVACRLRLCPAGSIAGAGLFLCLFCLSFSGIAPAQNGKAAPGTVFVHTALGGFILGYDIDRNATEGLLAESLTLSGGTFDVAVETFDQKTGKILKVITGQKATKNDFVTLGIFGTSVGLVEEELSKGIFVDKRVYKTINPVSGNQFTGKWTPPFTKNDIILSMPFSQGSPTAALLYFNNGGSFNSSVLSTNVSANTFGTPIPLTDSIFDLSNSPVMAYDSQTNQAIVASSGGSVTSIPKLAEVDLTTGNVTEFQGLGFGFVNGIAVDPVSGIACTTTEIDFSIEFYNLAAHTGFIVTLQGATSQLNSGGDVEFDPVHKLFFIGQEFSSVAPSGSSIQVYDEQGNFVKAINGLSLPASPAYMALQPSNRTGYVIVTPALTELQKFTY
jgi:hypothetical protein